MAHQPVICTEGEWVELTALDASAISFQNHGPSGIMINVTTGPAPTSFDGAVRVLPGEKHYSLPLIDLAPGVAGGESVWAYATEGGAVVTSFTGLYPDVALDFVNGVYELNQVQVGFDDALAYTGPGKVFNGGLAIDSDTETLKIPAAVIQAAILAATGSSAMPAAISIAIAGYMTYADEGTFGTNRAVEWAVDGSNRIRQSLSTSGADVGKMFFAQSSGGVQDTVNTVAAAYTPGVNVPFSIASYHTATAINGAHEGTLLTANVTPTALADLVAADFEIAQLGNFIIEGVRIWFTDIGDAGIQEAAQL